MMITLIGKAHHQKNYNINGILVTKMLKGKNLES